MDHVLRLVLNRGGFPYLKLGGFFRGRKGCGIQFSRRSLRDGNVRNKVSFRIEIGCFVRVAKTGVLVGIFELGEGVIVGKFTSEGCEKSAFD